MISLEAVYGRYAQARIAILGSNGFVGRWVARALQPCTARLHLFVRDRCAAEDVFSDYGIAGEVVEADLCNCEHTEELLDKIQPSIVFNLAGYGVDRSERDEQLSYQLNAQLLDVLCRALARMPDDRWPWQRIVHAGSALEYGAISGNLAEGAIPNPTTVYGQSKLLGTRILRNNCTTLGIAGLTARLFTLYGPGEHATRLLPSLLEAAHNNAQLELTAGTQRRDFTYIEDAAEGLLRLGCSAAQPGEAVNLATGTLTTVRRFAEIAAKCLGISLEHLKFGALPTRTEEMEHSDVTVDRLRQLTEWRPSTTVVAGIQRTRDFYAARTY